MSQSQPQSACSFAEVVAAHEGPLVRYAARLLGDVDRARDVVQDTFLRLMREDSAKLDGRLAPWLYRVCRNRALDVKKKEHRMKALQPDRAEACESREADQSEALERQETAQRALSLLEKLPDNQQEVLRLKFQNGLSYREISEVTGLSLSNVGYLIHVGLKTLRTQMAV